MQTYGHQEAELQAWKNKLAHTSTRRALPYEELMTILNNTQVDTCARYKQFHDLRNKLLSKQHGQGLTWDSHFEWLGRIVSFFSLPWKNPQPGSRLRQALLAIPEVKKASLLTLDDYTTCQPLTMELTTKSYEDTLFINPIKALADIKYSLKNQRIDVIEKIQALKYQLDANLYQYLLAMLYQQSPKETLAYFYQSYLNDNLDPPEPQDFVELHAMAQTLISQFVIMHSNISVHNHSGLYLLSLLSLNESDKLLSRLYSQEPDELSLQIKHYITQLKGLKNKHIIKNAKKESSGISITPLHLLTDLYQTIESLKHVDNFHELIKKIRHPLIHHVGRLLIEQMFIDYIKNPKEDMWKVHHYGFDSIELIATHILKSHFLGFSDKHQHDFLANLIYSPLIPKNMQRAEQYATELILAQAKNFDSFIITMRHLRSEKQTNFTRFEIEWITSRLSRIDSSLLPFINHMLCNTTIYDQIESKEPASSQQPDDLLKTIQNYIEQANQAFLSLDSGKENQAIYHAVQLVNQSLSNQRLTCEHLNQLFNDCLPKLSLNYITPELCQRWRYRLRAMQSNAMRWTEDHIATIVFPIIKHGLEQAQDHLQKARIAHGNDYHSDFVAEQHESKLATYYLAHYFKQPMATEHEEARSLLLSLNDYLAPAQFAKWYAQLEQIIASEKSFPNSFFYHAPKPERYSAPQAINSLNIET